MSEPCRSGHADCTVDCGWCKGTGIQGGKPGVGRDASATEQACASLHPTLMVRCILKDAPHLTGKGGGRVHLFSTAWEDRERSSG